MRFGLVRASASPFKSLAPPPSDDDLFVYAEALTREDAGDVPLGFNDDVTVIAVPVGPLRIAVERRDLSQREELALVEGAARIDVRSGSRVDGPFDARHLRRFRRRVNDDRWSTALALLKPDMRAIATGVVPLVAQAQSNASEKESGEDLVVKAENGRLTTFEGRFYAQQICLAVPGSDYSRFNCRMTPLRVVVKGAQPESGPADAATVRLGRAPSITYPLDGSSLHVKRSDDLLDLKFGFSGLALVIEPGRAVLTSSIEPQGPNGVAWDNSAIMTVELPPQHIAERAYFRQGQPTDDKVCAPPALALMFPNPSDDWFEAFSQELQQRWRGEATLASVAFKYDGPASLRSHPAHAPTIRHLAQAALEKVRKDVAEAKDDAFEEITQARLSGPSRLAFRVPYFVPGSHDARFEVSLELDALTDWRNLELSVVRRAESFVPDVIAAAPDVIALTTDTARRLAYLGLRTRTNASRAQDRLSDIVAGLRPPCERETAIELPFRLFLSPNRQARFLTPRPRSQRPGQPIPLWTADLDWTHAVERRGIGDVRAVWSTDFRLDVLAGSVAPPPRGPFPPWTLGLSAGRDAVKNEPRFRTALDAYDRHELVILSSVHGLPVLPHRGDDGRLTGDQLAPPVEFVLDDVDIDPQTSEQDATRGQALYDPQPLGVSELELSTLGGNVDLDATFEPPYAARRSEAGLFPSLSVERVRHRTVLGRDVLVEVAYKGFLFPIGHRCALVKITERVFAANPNGGHPTAYLTQRMFLRVSKPVKEYPAVGQPFDGRAWPARSITVVTQRTPDLVDPSEGFSPEAGGGEPAGFAVTPTGRLQRAQDAGNPRRLPELTGLVCWPRTAPCRGADVRFEIRIDGAAESVRVPLLFVDNVAVGEAADVADIVNYYEALEAEPSMPALAATGRGRWDHGGAIRRYAVERISGEASLLTLQWVVGAEGRRSNAPTQPAGPPKAWGPDTLAVGNRDFGISPVMNAANQPPFYPRLRSASVRLQSFERLAGRQEPPVTASYLTRYLRNDFEPSQKNTFAALERNGTAPFTLRFSGDGVPPAGDRGGGVGQPNLIVNAFSPDVGPTLLVDAPGSTRLAPDAPRSRIRLASTGPVLVQGPAPPPEGTESLRSLLKDAKILGLNLVDLVDLAKVVASEAHPKLRETLEFGANEVASSLDDIQNTLRRLLVSFDNELTGKLKDGPIEPKALLALYPDLSESKRELEKALATTGAAAAIARAAEPARRLVAALGRAASDPLAPVRDAARDAFRRLISGLLFPDDAGQEALLASLRGLKPGLRRAVQDLLKTSNLFIWRRIVLGLPSVRPERAASLPDLDAAVERIWRSAVDDAFVQEGTASPLAKILGTALDTFSKRFSSELGARRTQLGAAATTEIRAELDRLEREAAGRVRDGLLAGRLEASLAALETALEELDEADLRDLARLLDHLGRLGTRMLALVATEMPALVDRKLAAVCTDATDALSLVTVASLPTEVARRELLAAQTALTSASDGIVRGVSSFERSIRIRLSAAETSPWPADLRQVLEAWTDRLRNAAGALVQRLDPALGRLLEATRTVQHDDIVARACRDPRTMPFGLLRELDEARRQTLGALHEAYAAFFGEQTIGSVNLTDFDLASLRMVIERQLTERGEGIAAGVRQDLLKSLDGALMPLQAALEPGLKALVALTTRAVDASTVLGAAAREAEAAQARAIAQVRDLLRGLAPAVAASADLASDLGAAASFFDPDRLRRTRDDLAGTARAVAGAEGAQLVKAGLVLHKAVEALAADHIAALDTTIQRARALILGSVDEVVQGLLSSLAPTLSAVLAAVDQIDRHVVVARTAAIGRLNAAASNAGAGEARNLAGLAALLTILPTSVPGASKARLLACPFFVTASPGRTCPDGVETDPSTVRDLVAVESETVRTLKAQLDAGNINAATLETFRVLAGEWRADGPAVAHLVRQLLDLSQDILRGDLGRFIDLAGFRTKIERELRSLLPISSNLEHVLELDIDPPEFLKKVFIPRPSGPGKHLTIKTTSRIDLLPGAVDQPVSIETKGTLCPFEIRLLGDKLDVATLQFSAASFHSLNGGNPSFRISFLSFKPGQAIDFVQPLQKFLSPGDTGPRIQPLKRAPGVEAGYGLNLGIISIGTVSFANVVLDAAAELPFDDTDAKFRIGLGRRDAPFLISAFPYTGGGYFAVVATGGKIDGFEASFEFGGGGAFRFGPLSGQGRLTTGISIRQSGPGAYMDGFFYCGGSARVAFFGVSASLTVRMSLSDGAMAGEAVFEYAFSLGIKDFKFQVPVWRRMENGFGRTTLLVVPTTDHAQLDVSPATGRVPETLLAMREPIRVASHAVSMIDVDTTGSLDVCRPVPGASFIVPEKTDDPFACAITTAMCQSQDWDSYASYFDTSLIDRMPTR